MLSPLHSSDDKGNLLKLKWQKRVIYLKECHRIRSLGDKRARFKVNSVLLWIPIAINSPSLASLEVFIVLACVVCVVDSWKFISSSLGCLDAFTLVIAVIRVSMLSTSPSQYTEFTSRHFLNSFPVSISHHRFVLHCSSWWGSDPSSSTHRKTLVSLLFSDFLLCSWKWMEKFNFL